MNNIKVILISALFVGCGFLLLSYPDAPKWIGWLNILFFGIGGCLFIIIKIYQKLFPNQAQEHSRQASLRDGKDYEVKISDQDIKLIHTVSQETKSMNWYDITEIYAIAIDAFPVGNISWVFHKGSDVMEIPWETKNGDTLLKAMQSKLPGFRNEAVIEMSSTLHSYKKIWGKA